jgi:pimeloyl-ACP methyl ester carboxylesterase
VFGARHGLAVAGIVLASSLPAAAQQTTAPLLIAKQGSFFVGGRDVSSDTLSTLPTFAPTGTITVDQVYVRYQIPVDAKRHPITLIHGCCLTGATWETTPDGRMGWDEYFVRKGYPVYVVDQSWRGRSAADPSVINSVKLGKTPPDQLPTVLSAGHEAAWAIFRIGSEYPKVFPGSQFPVEAIGEFWKQMVPDWVSSLPTPNPTVPALSELASRLQGTVLVSHSQSGIYPFQTAMLSTKGIAGIVSIEPAACPDPKADLAPYTRLPILIVWGDYVNLSPRWSPRVPMCRAFADAVTSAGGTIQNVALPEVGMRGNSHMLMQDRNNLEVADWLLAWIDRHVAGATQK